LRLVSRSYTGDSRFMVLLLIPPFLSCAYGLAGNLVTYTGHSAWTLTNSVLIAGFNTAFCWLLIPRYGLFGAGLATALAMTMISFLQMVELNWLERVRIRLSAVYKPHVALLAAACALAVFWDPAQIEGLGMRIAVGFGVVALYGAVLYALRHEELLKLVDRAR
jgi:O-antigen/teichoic acid export membrane protein